MICAALVAAVFFAFGPLLAGDYEFFNVDDDDYVAQNRNVQNGLTHDGIRWAFTAFHSHNWHPLTWLSLQLDASLFGLVPWGFRLTNILLHAIDAVLLFAVFRRMTGSLWPSAAVAALFALHPLHVESVAWICGRTDVLCTLLALGSFLLYRRARTSRRRVRKPAAKGMPR